MSEFFKNFVEELEAKLAIEDCLLRFARAVDRQDWDAALQAYHDGATDNHGFFNGKAKDLLELLKKTHAKQEHSMHLCTNMLIDFKSAERAVVESYIVTFQRFDAGADQSPAVRNLGVARYLDLFEKRDGKWRVAERTLVLGDLIREELAESARFPQGFVQQKHNMDDPLYALLKMS